MTTHLFKTSLVVVAVVGAAANVLAQGGPVPVIQDGTPAVLTTGSAPRTPSGKPELSGVWAQPSTDGNAILQKTLPPFRGGPPQLTPWTAERYEYNRDARQAPPALGDYAEGFGGRRELNTILKCMPAGAPYLIAGWGSVSPSKITQTDKRVLIFYEFDHNNIRQIWTDGRKHPESIDPSWVGHSIGRWEGDTLIVETVGLRPEPWLNSGGHVASEGLRIEERYRRLDSHTMEIHADARRLEGVRQAVDAAHPPQVEAALGCVGGQLMFDAIQVLKTKIYRRNFSTNCLSIGGS